MDGRLAHLDELERSGRLEEAAALAETCALFSRAADLWERACAFRDAARAALAAGDPGRAFTLASSTDDVGLQRDALHALTAVPERLRQTAHRLAALGRFAAAATLHEAAGDFRKAGELFERARRCSRAADAFVRAHAVSDAIRCLKTRLGEDPGDDRARVHLGRLLVAHHPEAAARVVQQVGPTSSERSPALATLGVALRALGMPGAAAIVERDAAALGATSVADRGAIAGAAPEGEVLFGRYTLVAERAVGATARVYEAVDRTTDRHVAVKVYSVASLKDFGRDARRRFEREAQVLAALRSASIVPLVEYRPDAPAVVLAWMPGGSLAERFALGPVSPAFAADVVVAILTALGDAHARGVLHRDVKPANVLFDAARNARLADFGSAHFADAAATVTEALLGTLAYLSPERRKGAAASPSSDIFAAGAIFWEALTGAPPGLASTLEPVVLDDAQRAIARRLVGDEATRPNDAKAAIALLRSVVWPACEPARAPIFGVNAALAAAGERPAVAAPQLVARFSPLGGERFHDTLLDRDVLGLVATPEVIATARAFARAGHPSLATVFDFDDAARTVHVEPLRAAPRAGRLSAADRADLDGAVRSLHRTGGVHGAIDTDHVVRRGASVALAFPDSPGNGSQEADLVALGRLD
jgi:serine/threonine-protein kinase